MHTKHTRSLLFLLGLSCLQLAAFDARADGPPPPPLPSVRSNALKLAQSAPPPGLPTPTAQPAPVPAIADSLAWDAVMKEMDAKPGQQSAEFFFAVTNISQSDVVIDHVQTSCGCTVAKLPSQPWVLKPKDDGKVNVTVDLRGKPVGTMFKTITVFFTNNTSKPLNIKVTIPDNPEMARLRNQQSAIADRQHVFKDDCAKCHAEPTHGKTGKELYAAACGICHDAEHRATMVPDLHALNHSTDRIYWKQWIANGKVGSAMPAFSTEQGGPLNAEQIDSLVTYLDAAIPHNPVIPGQAAAAPKPGTPPPIPVITPNPAVIK